MARPLKKGIDYFSFDIDFFEDEKIEPVSGEFGIKGEIIIVRLLCAVYRNGYFVMWDDKLKMTLANRCKVSSDLVDKVIHRLVKWGFLDRNLFDSDKVITSRGIQKRFQEATRKRKYDYSSFDFWLLNDTKKVSSAHNADTGELFPPETTQSKVKESINSLSPTRTREGELPFDYRVLDKPLDKCHQELKSNQSWAEQFCMNIRHEFRDFLPEQFPEYLDAYFRKLVCEGVTHKSPSDAQSHFYNWLKVELKNNKNEKRSNKKPRGGGTVTNNANTAGSGNTAQINTASNDLEDFINGLSIGR